MEMEWKCLPLPSAVMFSLVLPLQKKCVQLLLSQNSTGTNEYNLKHE